MPQIKVPREFFVKERNQVYSNWLVAFWRELIQNSVDANATLIEARVDEVKDEHDKVVSWRVTFTDDGHGMSRATLEEVYMALGRSKKADGAAGGFGRARILTCFSHPWWRLRSEGWVCEVDETGTGYEVEAAAAPLAHGMVVEVLMDKSPYGHIKTALQYYLATCYLPGVVITYNGEQESTTNLPLGERLRDLGTGAALHKSDRHSVVCQVNGLGMFERTMPAEAPFGVIIDLEPELSRSLLTASRDNPTAELAEELDRMVAQLARGKTGAVRPPLPKNRSRVQGRNGLRVRRQLDKVSSELVRKERVMPKLQLGSERVMRELKSISSLKDTLREIDGMLTTFKSVLLVHDSMFVMDTNLPELRKVGAGWDPSRWWGSKVKMSNGQEVVGWDPTVKPRVALLMAWQAACDVALDALGEALGIHNLGYAPGFIINESLLAAHVGLDDGSAMLLNPLEHRAAETSQARDEARVRSIIAKRTEGGCRWLLAAAMHEACHVAGSDHDEGFASLLTTLIALVPQGKAMEQIYQAWKA